MVEFARLQHLKNIIIRGKKPLYTNIKMYFCRNLSIKNKMKKDTLKHFFALLMCIAVLAAVALNRTGKVLGHDVKEQKSALNNAKTDSVLTLQHDGTQVINTTILGKNIKGYGGTVPLKVFIKQGRITNIVALKNQETPDFFEEASSLFSQWIGKDLKTASTMKVDAVSGATFSSKAIINNVQLALNYAQKNELKTENHSTTDWSLQHISAIIVVLMAALIPLFYKNKWMRRIQFALNIVVLGLWSGTFISYSLLVNYVENGINPLTTFVPFVMLITAFVYPMLGKKNYYCNHICPYGSLQELAGIPYKRKWKMNKNTVKRLEQFRELLWTVLMMLMLSGIGFEWLNYEVFSAFLLTAASWIVIAIAVVFLVLSVFVPRPYCRFICPTGTLFKVVQSRKIFKK